MGWGLRIKILILWEFTEKCDSFGGVHEKKQYIGGIS